jgi:LysR family transcriptional regulator, glycine cleavage system transcriptional activator
MLRNLHLSALRAFEAATRTGSFRLAADDLGLTPSAVSHAIRGLERDLGTVLFEREGRTIRLTPEGETLMRHVERGFGELHLGLGSIAARKPQLLKLHRDVTGASERSRSAAGLSVGPRPQKISLVRIRSSGRDRNGVT